MMDRHLFVVYTTDNRFSEILGVSLVSLYANNKGMEQITVYIMENGISNENRKKIETVSNKYERQEIQWINLGNIYNKLGRNILVDRGSMSQYARIFIASYLPLDLERVLYLDCDTIVKQSLYELWNLDIHNKTIAASMDAFSKWYRKNIDLKADDIMFNSGIMLIDLKLWRKNEIEKKLINFIKEKNGRIQQGDQGALNAILSRDVYCFEPKYNSLTIFYDFSYKEMLKYRKPPKYYSKEQILEAVNEPVIIHYTTSFMSLRPWEEGCHHQYVNEWLKYKSISPWKDTNLLKPKPLKSFYRSIIKVLPRKFTIWVSSILQAYGRPFYNNLRLKLCRENRKSILE